MPQKKIANPSKFHKFKSFKKFALSKKKFKRYLKNKNYFRNANLRKYLTSGKKNTYRVIILFKPNNFFCTLVNFSENKTLYSISSGNYKVKTSKKLLKHTFKLVLDRFFRVIRKKVRNSRLIVSITSPTHLRKKVLDLVILHRISNILFLQIQKLKCYNGCRPAKKQRKKRKGLKLLK